jgi:hypothetical protein
MGLHTPKPIRKTKESICTQKPLARLNRKAKSSIHRHASDFRQSYRSGFSKVGVVSSNLIARSRSSPFERHGSDAAFAPAGHFVSVGDGSLASVYLACP